jgi:hypothetical protein
MADDPADPPVADDDVTKARDDAKGLLKEAMNEWLDERVAADKDAPSRTKKPANTIYKSLFGG